MSDERDTRVETLRAGDQIRYLGEWYDVVKVVRGVGRAGYIVGLTIDDRDAAGEFRQLVYRVGTFVAAECNPRREEVPA